MHDITIVELKQTLAKQLMFTLYSSDTYSKPCHISNIGFFANIINVSQLSIFGESFILDV